MFQNSDNYRRRLRRRRIITHCFVFTNDFRSFVIYNLFIYFFPKIFPFCHLSFSCFRNLKILNSGCQHIHFGFILSFPLSFCQPVHAHNATCGFSFWNQFAFRIWRYCTNWQRQLTFSEIDLTSNCKLPWKIWFGFHDVHMT